MTKIPKERLTYTFSAWGHPQVKATHVKTIEFTKDDFLTDRGDCILGIKADFIVEKLKEFSGKVKMKITVEADSNTVSQEFKFTVNPGFNSDHEFVLRKSMYPSERTFGFNLNIGAVRVDRAIVALLRQEAKVRITLLSGWFD